MSAAPSTDRLARWSARELCAYRGQLTRRGWATILFRSRDPPVVAGARFPQHDDATSLARAVKTVPPVRWTARTMIASRRFRPLWSKSWIGLMARVSAEQSRASTWRDFKPSDAMLRICLALDGPRVGLLCRRPRARQPPAFSSAWRAGRRRDDFTPFCVHRIERVCGLARQFFPLTRSSPPEERERAASRLPASPVTRHP